MNTSDLTTTRRAGLAGALGGLLTLASGLFVATVITPTSDVSDEMWSYPWWSEALVLVSLVYAVFHLLVVAGLLGFGRSGAAGSGRAARAGIGLAIAGTVVLVIAELASIPIADQRMDDTGPALVGATFGLGTVLSAVGFVLAGVATVRAARWQGWRRWAPLALGVWTVALLGLIATPAMPVAIGIYGALLTAVGLAVATDPAPAAPRPRTDAVQV